MFTPKICATTALCFLLSGIHVNAQGRKAIPAEKPKLIIGIVVDQMRYDFLYRYSSTYGNNGFKRMLNEGTTCKNATYDYMCTLSEPGYATITTGCNPSVHGIIAGEWYQPISKKKINCVADENVKSVGGSFNSGKYSPKQMFANSIGDELRISNNKQSKVISVSINPAGAVLLGGSAANSAWWYDAQTGNFTTSSYYMEQVPSWVDEFNNKKLVDTYLQRTWDTKLPIADYVQSLPDDNKYENGINGKKTFPYDLNLMSLPKPDTKRNYSILTQTPFANSLTKDFAISAIVNENLGKDDNTDILWIDFAATQTIAQNFGLTAIETQDAYLRLDEEVEHFLDFIESYIGKGNVVVFLTSNHGASHSPQYLIDNGLPSGSFSMNQAAQLLSSYLNVRYGKGNWINYNENLQLYLNKELIEDSKLNLEAFEEDVAQFMLQFTGVANVLTSSVISKTYFDKGVFQKMQNSYNQKRSGDILINLAPGWVEKNGNITNTNTGYRYDSHVPLLWYGWKIPRQNITRPISITDIAPTLSQILDIAFPAGTQGSPIGELVE